MNSFTSQVMKWPQKVRDKRLTKLPDYVKNKIKIKCHMHPTEEENSSRIP